MMLCVRVGGTGVASSGAACTVGDEAVSGTGVGVVVGAASTSDGEVGDGSKVDAASGADVAAVGVGAASSSADSPQPISATANKQIARALLQTFTRAHSFSAAILA